MSAQRASFDDYLEAFSTDQMRQLHDRKFGLLITGSLILGMMAAGGPAYAASSGSDELDLPPLTATSSEDVPDEYLVYPDGTPLPADALVMTDAEMDALGSDTDISTPDSTPGATARATVVGNCYFAVGNMWKRSSAKGFPHGGAGAKPAICNGTGQHTFRVVSYFKASGAKDVIAAEAQLRSGDYKLQCG